MVLITLLNGMEWWKPNWMFEDLLDEARFAFSERTAALELIEMTSTVGGVDFGLLDPHERVELSDVLLRCAINLFASGPRDEIAARTQQGVFFREAMQELASLFDA